MTFSPQSVLTKHLVTVYSTPSAIASIVVVQTLFQQIISTLNAISVTIVKLVLIHPSLHNVRLQPKCFKFKGFNLMANQCQFCVMGIQVCGLCGLYPDRIHVPMALSTLIIFFSILMVKKTNELLTQVKFAIRAHLNTLANA